MYPRNAYDCNTVLKNRVAGGYSNRFVLLKGTQNKVQFSYDVAKRNSVERLATGSTVRGSNPGAAEIFRTPPDRPWHPPSLLYNGYRVVSGVKRLRRDVNHPPRPA
jgi:hypothetical protein